jgi:hypothetical protein
MAEPPLKLVKADGPGIQKRLFDAFSVDHQMSPDQLKQFLIECGCEQERITAVMQSSTLKVGAPLQPCWC